MNAFKLLVSACLLSLFAVSTQAQSVIQYDASGNTTNVAAAVAAPPTIVAPPASQSVDYGQSASLSVSASGSGPLTYQWFNNNVLIPGATNSTLFLSDVTTNGPGYTVVVSDSFGSVTSSVPAAVVVSGYEITSVAPVFGPTAGGTVVTILGTGFQFGATVAFGALPGTAASFVSPTSLTAVTPASSGSGPVNVSVTNPSGQVAVLTNGFTYVAPQCVPPAPGLLSWWRGEDNASDFVGTNQGTLENGAGYGIGEVGQAFQFDGVASYFVAPAGGLPVGNSDRTLELWAKVDAVVTSETFFAGYGSFGTLTAAFELYATGGQIAFSQWGSAISGGSLVVGQWQHIAVTSQGGFVTLYVDGQSVASGSQNINTTSGSQFYMGMVPGTYGQTRKIQGEVDEVSVYNRALTSNEIAAIYMAGIAGKCIVSQVSPVAATLGPFPSFRSTASNIARRDGIRSRFDGSTPATATHPDASFWPVTRQASIR